MAQLVTLLELEDVSSAQGRLALAQVDGVDGVKDRRETALAFLSDAERLALGSSLVQIEARETENASQRGLKAAGHRPPLHISSVPLLAELDGAAVASDPTLVDAFIREGRPVLIRGYADALGWPACAKWADAEAFGAHYGSVPFKWTELRMPAAMGRQKPLPLRLPLGVYARYADANGADHPWYCFGDDFERERAAFLADFEVPPPWREDLYELSPELRAAFPAYRYMVIGGARTGSNLHVDPDFTAAWNALLAGTKRWALFPPDAGCSSGAAQRDLLGAGTRGTAPLCWWLDHYSRLAKAQEADPSLGMVECEQRAGDIIYVPAGWWHCVLNTVDEGLTIAVTQNSLPPAALSEKLWAEIALGNPWLAAALARELAASPSAPVSAPTLERAAAWLSAHDARQRQQHHPRLEQQSTSRSPSDEESGRMRPAPAVLFFALDGVLDAKGEGGQERFALDARCTAQLARVVRETSAELVLTAPCRASEEAKAQLGCVLAAQGLCFSRAVTTAEMPGGPASQLASQIIDFIVRPATAVERWAIVDSVDLLGGRADGDLSLMQTLLRARLVRTEPTVGLDAAAADRLIAILNEEEEE